MNGDGAGPGAPVILAWRHPRAIGAEGRCIGRTDLRVDPRRAKRLAHRLRSLARREGLPRVVHTSDLRRARDVGRWLRRWGWSLVVDARLSELDFGDWDGRRWDEIARGEVDAWSADLAHARPGGGESQAALCARVRAFVEDARREAGEGGARCRLVVSHGGWIAALARGMRPVDRAASWTPPPAHGVLSRVGLPA